MDVNWYAVERIAHQRLAELRTSVAACRRAQAFERREPVGRARTLIRLGQRALGGLVAVRAVAWKWLG